ncbi:M48 family metalloprotease [Mesorhizobium sp. M0520]|uniref:M48 family metalloprotease n=1 Tax=Mesorhizobium sp. M0520 TaxID=2956957 RepID=UPI003339853A
MTLATSIFGTETRLRPLVKAILVVTALRVAWLAININHHDTLSVAWALVPWPWPMYSAVVWASDLALVFYQLRAAIRLGRLLLLQYAPHLAGFVGFAAGTAGDERHLKPRHRSWWPTALQLCGAVVLTCWLATWLVLMLAYNQWAPFDWYMATPYAHYAMLVGLALSLLGLMFGGRYIARASGDVSTSFGVTSVDDGHWLAERVHGIAERLDLPKPAVGVTNVVNAFAMGANQKSSMVVIGKPLFAFEKDELDAIIGHELGHILHNDVARMQFAEGFQRMLVRVVNTLTVIGAIMAALNAEKRSDARRNVRIALGSGRIVRKTVFVGSELVTKGISRNREFHADAVGARVTSPDAMARALKRIHGVADKPTAEERHYGYLMFRGAAFGNLFSTHPTLRARLKALDAHALSQEAARAAVAQDALAVPGGVHGLGVAGASTSDVARSLAWAKRGTMTSGLARRIRRVSAVLRAKITLRRLLIVGAACVVLAVVAPAITSFYALDRRFDDAKASAGQAVSSSWTWVVDTKEAWLGDADYAERVRQLDVREQAVTAAEARLAAPQQTARTQLLAPTVDSRTLSGLIAERDKARADAENLKRQVASLAGQLSSMTADRDEMTHRNDVLRDMNLELKGQIASRDMARVDLDRQIQDLRNQIASQTTGQPESQEQSNLPGMIPATSHGGFGAFAAAGNGAVILTEGSFATSQDASDAAMAECSRFSGGSRCEVKEVFRDTCAAVARVIPASKKSRYELQFGGTPDEAGEMALSECFQQNRRPCEVIRQTCVQ